MRDGLFDALLGLRSCSQMLPLGERQPAARPEEPPPAGRSLEAAAGSFALTDGSDFCCSIRPGFCTTITAGTAVCICDAAGGADGPVGPVIAHSICARVARAA